MKTKIILKLIPVCPQCLCCYSNKLSCIFELKMEKLCLFLLLSEAGLEKVLRPGSMLSIYHWPTKKALKIRHSKGSRKFRLRAAAVKLLPGLTGGIPMNIFYCSVVGRSIIISLKSKKLHFRRFYWNPC